MLKRKGRGAKRFTSIIGVPFCLYRAARISLRCRNAAQYRVCLIPGQDEYAEAPRIMAVTWGEGEKTPTMVVALDERGNLVDLLPCGQLSGMVGTTCVLRMCLCGDECGQAMEEC